MDDPAYSEFYRFMQTEQRRFVNIATQRVGNRLDAEQIVADLFVRFWRRLGRPNPPAPPRYRVFAEKMVSRMCTRWLIDRRKQTERFVYIDHPVTEHDSDFTGANTVDVFNAADVFAGRVRERHRAEARRLTAYAVKQLDREARWFFVKRHLQGTPLRAIAEAQGISIAWASVRCERVLLDFCRIWKEAAAQGED